ncbi:MAG: hypothetical protein Q8N99_08240 [Nanoarchaeota archaeon]|nr:hypothetical protein [Nanoarchaeota archaeon]
MAEAPTQKIKRYQSIEELAVQLRDSDYSLEFIQEHLVFKRHNTTDALLYETEIEKIKVRTEPGKTAWRTVLEHYKRLRLEDELNEVNKRLYELDAPLIHQAYNAIYIDTVAFFWVMVTLGIDLAAPRASNMRNSVASKYIQKALS